ncbi:SDR family NAD(P)-dependent oxidoreductase [Ketobacter sp.]|uniref:SDR family NAD(P)-dependent oxidoreductase n=1 Tax=Ketobacter sp. TaxID=2083498 RepID=UPI0025C61508|nr:SDR family NAD(P)-dependent oxidoreductase [Ketobacter sp.]
MPQPRLKPLLKPKALPKPGSRPDMKTAFITGSASGIGAGLVSKLLEQGWRVFAGHRSTDPSGAPWYGHHNVIPVQCDVTHPEQIELAQQVIRQDRPQGLDLLINNAAYSGNSGVVEAADLNDYRYTFESNFWGPLQMCRAMMPLLRQARGRIINITSASIYLTIPMGSSYPVSKTALDALTRHLRMELAPFGVEVTALAPGGVATPMTAFGAELSEQQWQAIPEPLRSQYRQYFLDGASAVSDNFKLYSPEAFAERVYRKVICARTLKPAYLIGPGVAALPWLHRLLPVQQVQNIWLRMFSVKN